MKNKKYGSAITVEWHDAVNSNDWMSIDDALKIPQKEKGYVKTRGFYIGEKKGYLVIADSIGKTKEEDIGGVWCIPKAWIKKIR